MTVTDNDINMGIPLENIFGRRLPTEDFTQRVYTDIPEVSSLPQPVQKFCDEIESNFKRTVGDLRIRALQLQDAASELEHRALKLEEALPYVKGEIERWISYERECATRQQSLALVKG